MLRTLFSIAVMSSLFVVDNILACAILLNFRYIIFTAIINNVLGCFFLMVHQKQKNKSKEASTMNITVLCMYPMILTVTQYYNIWCVSDDIFSATYMVCCP